MSIPCVRPRVRQGDAVLLAGVKGAGRVVARVEAGAGDVVIAVVGTITTDHNIIVEDLARQLDVVVGELANLGVVDSQNLGLLVGAQAQARDHVDEEQDERREDERVETPRDAVGELVAQLHPVVVEPPAGDDGDAVQGRDGAAGEKGRADVAHEAADGVHGKDVEGVVHAH